MVLIFIDTGNLDIQVSNVFSILFQASGSTSVECQSLLQLCFLKKTKTCKW